MSESKQQCSIEGCSRPVCSRGWCTTHYDRWRKGRDVNAPIGPYGTKGICPADGCEKPATHKGWCLLHYARWRRRGDPLIAEPRRGAAELKAFRAQTKQCARCAQDFSPTSSETEETWAKRRFCSRECSRTSPLGRYAIDVIQVKVCVECGKSFTRPPQFSAAQWDERRCCSARCGNALGARGRPRQLGDLDRKNYGSEWARRQAMPRWAAAWEDQRRQEDAYDLADRLPVLWQGDRSIVQGKAAVRISQRPKTRLFYGVNCACGASFIADKGRFHDCVRCAKCNKRYWRGTHRQRARKYGAEYEPIDPIAVFVRDNWRCQLCGKKTSRKPGTPRSAVLDHIVPLARGGHHVIENVHCAHARCNGAKGVKAMNEQLLLRVA